MAPVSGHVYRFEGQRRPTWRAKYRLPDGRQVKRTIGPARTERGRPRAGYYTRRTAEAWLRDVLDQVRDGTLPGMVRTGVTFADACDEYLRYVEFDLDRKPSTLCDYRSIIRAHLKPAFGALRLEDVSAEGIEAWTATLTVGNRTKIKILTVLNGVLTRHAGSTSSATTRWPRSRSRATGRRRRSRSSRPRRYGRWSAPPKSEQDGAIFLTAAFTGLRRGELIALRWRDVDFAASRVRVCGSFAGGRLTTPKNGKVRSLPMAPDVARTLAGLAERERWSGDDDLVFPGVAGSYLDASALSRRYKAALESAALRRLRSTTCGIPSGRG